MRGGRMRIEEQVRTPDSSQEEAKAKEEIAK